MQELPSGTVTLLFTDIEGSTKLLHELGDRYADALAEHRRVMREAFGRHHGVEVDTQGDAFFVAFSSAPAAVAAAADAQTALGDGPILVRMGLHTGTPTVTDEGYVGVDVHKGARICAAGHGGQVLLSADTRSLLAAGQALVDLGEHRLKDFADPVPLFQLGDGLFPPLRTISNTNLPRPVSSFVGREREVADVVALLRKGTRLATLTGPGGTGKTRLSIEAASELVPDFRAGVFWVGLATIRDPALVLLTIGATLGAGADPADHIGEREMLLLLDNFEQVVDAAPEVGELLVACPNLKILVTSRELLRVGGEVQYAVPPLAAPEGVELFSERSQLEPDGDIAELVARLDSMPLAVELAAARTSVLTPRQILHRLGQRLDLLRGGRDADPRQRTLRATIEWSHDLLHEAERRLFAKLAIFQGGCTLESAEVVCDADIDTLQSLVEKSLVRHTDERFWMFETIREFALEQLDASGEREAMRRRHYDFLLRLADSANLNAASDEPDRMDLVLPERDNYRSALAAARDAGDVEGALTLAVALELWLTAISAIEGRLVVEPLLDARDSIPSELRAHGLRLLAATHNMTGDDAGALPLYEESREIFEELGDENAVGELIHRLAITYQQLGDDSRARPLAEEGLRFAERSGRRKLEAMSLRPLGVIEHHAGNVEIGIAHLIRAAEIAGEVGFRWWQEGCLSEAAYFALEEGRVEEAERWSRDALDLAFAIDDGQGLVYSFAQLAMVATARGEDGLAGFLWGATEAVAASVRPLGGWPTDAEEFAAAVIIESHDFQEGRIEGSRAGLPEAIDVALGRKPVEGVQ